MMPKNGTKKANQLAEDNLDATNQAKTDDLTFASQEGKYATCHCHQTTQKCADKQRPRKWP
jgi:hypothetical protein